MKLLKTTCRLCLALLVAAGLTDCGNRPDDVLSEDKTIDLLADLQLAESYRNTPSVNGGNHSISDLQERVLKAHGVTEEQFASTMNYYGRNVDEYYELCDKVDAKIRKKGEALNGNVMEEENIGNDIWPYSHFAYFNSKGKTDGLRFSINQADIVPGERLEWKLNLTVPDGIEGFLGVEYGDGSASLSKRNSSGNKTFSISLQSDTAKAVKRLFGYLSIPERSFPVWADSIQLLKTPFDSIEYSKIRLQQNISPLRTRPEKKTEENDSMGTGEMPAV